MALAAANPDDFPAPVKIVYFQVGRFRDAQAGPVHGGQNRSVAEVLRRLQQSLDLVPGQDDGELFLVPR